MNFTEKIAEQCNGASQCELSSQPTYIHKCGKTSDYLYAAYKCIREADTFDICQPLTRSFTPRHMDTRSIFIKSSDFPTEYSSGLDCSCLVENTANSNNLKLEMLWFSLQDNDILSVAANRNLTGWMTPTQELAVTDRVSVIRFVTDEALAYKGFWFKLATGRVCKDDWQLVGDSCLKVIGESLDWRAANQRCQQMNGHLVKIDDVVADLKLTQYMRSNYPEIGSYWIGLRKYVDQHNQEKWMWSNNSTAYSDVSWWPWRKNTNSSDTTTSNHCVLKKRGEDGYFTTLCDTRNKNSFICQTSSSAVKSPSSSQEVNLKCGATDQIMKEYERTLIKSRHSQFQTIGSNSAPIEQIVPVIVDDNSFIPTFKPLSSAATPVTKTTTHIIQQLAYDSSVLKTAPSTNVKEAKINTAVLAGIVSGIGLVIVVINLAVLFVCRRNLKKRLLKNGHKDTAGSSSSHDDIIQEYFEAFHTLHNNTR
jgi:hypothetical protein